VWEVGGTVGLSSSVKEAAVMQVGKSGKGEKGRDCVEYILALAKSTRG
jgi:hypothetical protein